MEGFHTEGSEFEMRDIDQIRRELTEFVESITPEGTAISINGSRFFDIQLTCNGADPEMGYYCSLPPNHNGQCWTLTKRVNFLVNKPHNVLPEKPYPSYSVKSLQESSKSSSL